MSAKRNRGVLSIAVYLAAGAAFAGESNLGSFQTAADQSGLVGLRRAIEARWARASAVSFAASDGTRSDPCDEQRELDKAAFRFLFEPGRPAGNIELDFKFKSCVPYYAEESPHGRLTVDEAIRRYEDAKTGYALVVVTPSASRSGRGASELVLVKEVRTISCGEIDTASLRSGTPIVLGAARIMKDAGPGEIEGTATLFPR